jgi:hypothetical protein
MINPVDPPGYLRATSYSTVVGDTEASAQLVPSRLDKAGMRNMRGAAVGMREYARPLLCVKLCAHCSLRPNCRLARCSISR